MSIRATVMVVGTLTETARDELDLEDAPHVVMRTDEDGARAFAAHIFAPALVDLVPAEPLFDQARLDTVSNEDVEVEMVVPFPNRTPTCALCGKEEVTHVAVFAVKTEGQEGSAFGGMCDACAEPYVAEVEAIPGAN